MGGTSLVGPGKEEMTSFLRDLCKDKFRSSNRGKKLKKMECLLCFLYWILGWPYRYTSMEEDRDCRTSTYGIPTHTLGGDL